QGPGHRLHFGASALTLIDRTGSRPDDASQPVVGTVGLRFPGARAGVVPAGEARLPGLANFFLGDDPAAWRADVPPFAAVRYAQLYRGIDLVYRGHLGALKSEWVVAPGADPGAIRLAYGGDVTGLGLDGDGNLRVRSGAGELVEAAPEVYQSVGGERVPVA